MEKLNFLIESSDYCAIVVALGPGDALRFCYSFSQYIEINNPINSVVLISEYARKNILDLLCFSKMVGNIKQAKQYSECSLHVTEKGIHIISFKNIFQSINKMKLPKLIYNCFESPFIDHLINDTTAILPELPNTRFELLDRTDSKRYINGTFSKFYTIKNKSVCKFKNVLISLRFENVIPERNTPVKLFKEIVNYLMKEKISIYFTGSVLDKSNDLKEYEKRFVNERHVRIFSGYPNYLNQLKYYNEQFDLVIGVNSGGLDLAIAGGVPAIRIGAFHHLLPKHGANYNSFLASAPVINIPAISETRLENITIEKFKVALFSLQNDIVYEAGNLNF